MTRLHDIGLAFLGFRLDDRFVLAFAEARLIVTGVAVRDDGGVRRDLAVCEPLAGVGVIVFGVGEASTATVPPKRTASG